jgi:hypothetical protein
LVTVGLLISVRPANSCTVPVTRTLSPMATWPAEADPNTNTASEAPGVASCAAVPPAPPVSRKKPLKPPTG